MSVIYIFFIFFCYSHCGYKVTVVYCKVKVYIEFIWSDILRVNWGIKRIPLTNSVLVLIGLPINILRYVSKQNSSYFMVKLFVSYIRRQNIFRCIYLLYGFQLPLGFDTSLTDQNLLLQVCTKMSLANVIFDLIRNTIFGCFRWQSVFERE